MCRTYKPTSASRRLVLLPVGCYGSQTKRALHPDTEASIQHGLPADQSDVPRHGAPRVLATRHRTATRWSGAQHFGAGSLQIDACEYRARNPKHRSQELTILTGISGYRHVAAARPAGPAPAIRAAPLPLSRKSATQRCVKSFRRPKRAHDAGKASQIPTSWNCPQIPRDTATHRKHRNASPATRPAGTVGKQHEIVDHATKLLASRWSRLAIIP